MQANSMPKRTKRIVFVTIIQACNVIDLQQGLKILLYRQPGIPKSNRIARQIPVGQILGQLYNFFSNWKLRIL